MSETRTGQILRALREHLAGGCGLLNWGAENALQVVTAALEEHADLEARLAAAEERERACRLALAEAHGALAVAQVALTYWPATDGEMAQVKGALTTVKAALAPAATGETGETKGGG